MLSACGLHPESQRKLSSSFRLPPSSFPTGTINVVFRAHARRKAISNLTPEEREILAKPWLNTFPNLEASAGEQPEAEKLRQAEVSGPIYRHIRDGLIRCVPEPRALLLTSTDGFFSIVTLWRGAKTVDVFDVCTHVPGHQGWHLDQIRLVAKISGYEERSTFQRKGLFEIEGKWDFCICTEILENYPDPEAALGKIRSLVDGPIVNFSSTYLPNDPAYLESPSEKRPWGSVFSHDRLITMIVDHGWTVVNERYRPVKVEWSGEENLSYLNCV
jgi:hypothetical protein